MSEALATQMRAALQADGGWWPFDRFMAAALYTPGLGYYSGGRRVLGLLPGDGSDFSTAPEMSPLFARCLARQIQQALDATGTTKVWEFGAGSGALAAGLLDALPDATYHVVELSGSLRQRQQARLEAHGARVQWHERLPEHIQGVVIGNEVLDAMPVKLAVRRGPSWIERGVGVGRDGFVWVDSPANRLILPDSAGQMLEGSVTELHLQAEDWTCSVGERLQRGLMLLIDYGFPEAEYYHPQRRTGTLIAHQAHRSDDRVLEAPGSKDITAHVNFTGIVLAAQRAGLELVGYTSQAHFLLNCGMADELSQADLAQRAMGLRLIHEHEMGELFKVVALAPAGGPFEPLGFTQGDRSHRL